MNSVEIDLKFIEKWEKIYDCHERDENDYSLLLNKVASDLVSDHSLKKETFIQFINWKFPRLKGIIKLNEYELIYKPVINNLKSYDKLSDSLRSVISLYGIGIPVASTILHFFCPEKFPKVDIRTTESLKHFGLWPHKTITEKNCWYFFEVISRIKFETGSTLRKIDRALFSFHKVYLKGKTRPTRQYKKP